MPDTDSTLAVFIDFENLALGFQNRRDRFDIARVLERHVAAHRSAHHAEADEADHGRCCVVCHALARLSPSTCRR